MTTTLIDDVRSLTERQRHDKDATFAALVEDVVAGRDIPADDVTAILDATGHTVDELHAAVQRRKTIDRHRATIRQAADAKGEIAALREQIAAEDAKLDDAKRERDDAVRPLQARIVALLDVSQQAVKAKGELRRLLPDDIADELAEHQRQLHSFVVREHDIQQRLRAARENVNAALEADRDVVPSFAAKVDELESELKDSREAKSEFAAGESAIFERLYRGDD